MKWSVWRWVVRLLVVSLVAGVFVPKLLQRKHLRIVSSSEEVEVAESLLGKKLSGPGYFNATRGRGDEKGGPWIDVADAMDQVDRIAVERKLSPDAAQRVRLLLDQMTESHPYRVVGGKRINLPRLNLSLDSIEK